MKNIEVELKFHIPKHSDLLNFLEKEGEFAGEFYQKDSYFAPSHQDWFATEKIEKWLRIRESDKGNSINYKHWKYRENENLNYCDEYNTNIGEADQIEKILTALDIKPIIVVDKHRQSFMYQGVEISLDEVAELGSYVELEMKGKFTSPEEARVELYRLAESLGLKREWQDQKGYPWLLLEKNGII